MSRSPNVPPYGCWRQKVALPPEPAIAQLIDLQRCPFTLWRSLPIYACDEESGERFEIRDDNTFTLPIKKHDIRLIRFEAGGM